MDLSSSSSDFIDLNNSHDDDHQKPLHGFDSKIVPSYDFQPIHPNSAVGLSYAALDLAGSTNSTAARVLSAADSKPLSTSFDRGFDSLESVEPTQKGLDTTIMSQIDRTMKKYSDNLLHAMEGVSARLTQLETRTHNIQDMVDALKVSVDNSHGTSDGKIRQLKNILLEVQSGVQQVKDKQDIFEAQLQLSKLNVSKADQNPKPHSLHHDTTAQPSAPGSMQQMPQFPGTSYPQPPSSAAAPSQKIHQPLSPQLLAQLPNQFSPQQEPSYSVPNHSQPPPPNQSPHQTQTPHQLPYQSPPQLPQYPQQPPGYHPEEQPPSSQLLPQLPVPGHSQPPPPNQSQTQTLQPPHQPPYQSQPQLPQYPQQPPSYHSEEQPQFPLQSYPPNPSHRHPPTGSAPSQQFYNSSQPQPSMYDGAGGRSNSGFPPSYSSEPYPYTGTPVKPPHMSSSGTGYPQLSNSRPPPHALPTASPVISTGGSNSPRAEGRVPVDDVIDRVTTMGFSRDQVRTTVRRLTENGQAVDLNVVLDKLMNPGGR